MSSAEATVRAFVERINAADVAGIGALMTEDHVFVDALGERHEGRGVMVSAWGAYFEMFPDYRVDADTAVADGDRVALFGSARATHAASGEVWQVPAAWLAIIRDGGVAEWRVYCDNGFGPLREILVRTERRCLGA